MAGNCGHISSTQPNYYDVQKGTAEYCFAQLFTGKNEFRNYLIHNYKKHNYKNIIIIRRMVA